MSKSNIEKPPADGSGEHPSPLSEVKEAVSFLGAGVAAIAEFFAGDDKQPKEAVVEDKGLAQELDDAVERIGRKIAPFPGQEG